MNESELRIKTAASTPASSQFGLVTLFYVVSVYTVGLALGTWTLPLTSVVLLFWSLRKRTSGCASGVLFLVVVFVLLDLLMPSLSQVRHAAMRSQCLNNNRSLALAIINFEAIGQGFPPAYKVDANGVPMHSWRVLVLPQLGYQTLYNQYDFTEAWDGPNNLKLLNQMPDEFKCPFHRDISDHTHYKLVVDEGTPFELGRTMDYGDILDGASNTICIVEDPQNPVPWTKPEGLTVEEAVAALAPKNPENVAHSHGSTFATYYSGASICLMDGSTNSIGATIKPETVRSLCVCNNGGTLDYDEMGNGVETVHWDKYFVLALYFVLLILPGFLQAKRPNRKRAKFNWRHY